VSDGVNASNAFQQGMDILRLLDAFDTGHGLRIILPDGRPLSGGYAAQTVLGVEARSMPIVLVGNSQGTMIGGYIMHANFVSRRAFDRPSGETNVPTGFAIRGAAMLAEYVKGLGHGYQVWWDGKSQRNSILSEAALRSDCSLDGGSGTVRARLSARSTLTGVPPVYGKSRSSVVHTDLLRPVRGTMRTSGRAWSILRRWQSAAEPIRQQEHPGTSGIWF
jgi:hypothetical protein